MYSRSLLLLALSTLSLTQNVTVPSYCTPGFQYGVDEAIVTVPYTYNQVMSIIGSYKNLTWSGNPDNTVTLNGTNNAVGTARTYDTAGAHVIETILEYSKPPSPGPYNEVHNTALLNIPALNNLSLYIIYDGTVVTSVCGGLASQLNFTAKYCGTNGTQTGALLHSIHTADGLGAAKLLGGANFTSCAALGANASATSTGSGSPTVSPYHGAGSKVMGSMWSAVGAVAVVGLAALW